MVDVQYLGKLSHGSKSWAPLARFPPGNRASIRAHLLGEFPDSPAFSQPSGCHLFAVKYCYVCVAHALPFCCVFSACNFLRYGPKDVKENRVAILLRFSLARLQSPLSASTIADMATKPKKKKRLSTAQIEHLRKIGRKGAMSKLKKYGSQYFSDIAKLSHKVNNPDAKRKSYEGGRPATA